MTEDILVRLETSKLKNKVIRDAAAEIRQLREEVQRLNSALVTVRMLRAVEANDAR